MQPPHPSSLQLLLFSSPLPGNKNCSENSKSLCESPPLLLAGAIPGICNGLTGICVCPSGYSGKDALHTWNDCHVFEPLKFGLEIAALVALSVAGCIQLFLLIRLLLFWGIISFHEQTNNNNNSPLTEPFPDEPFQTGGTGGQQQQQVINGGDKRGSNGINGITGRVSGSTPNNNNTTITSPPPPRRVSQLALTSPLNINTITPPSSRRISAIPKFNLSELASPGINAPSIAHQQNVAEKARRRSMIMLLILSMFYSFCGIWFQITRLVHGTTLDEGNVSQYLALSFGIQSFISCVWLLLVNWFSRLPSLQVFSTMFPELEKKFLFKHPNFIRVMAIANSVIMFALIIVFLLVIPVARPELSFLSLQISFIIAAVEVVVVATCSQAVSLLLLKIFRTLQTGLADVNKLDAKPKAKNKTLQEATVMIKVVLSISIIFGPSSIVVILMMGYWPWARAFYYLFLSVIWIGGACIVALSGILLVRLTMVQATRRRKSSAAGTGRDSSNNNNNNKRSSQSGDAGGIKV
jgi:hypothetical protein